MKKIHYKEVESMKNHHDDTISLSIKTKLNLLQKIEKMSRKSSGSNKRSNKLTKSVNSVPRQQSLYSIGSNEKELNEI